MKTLIFDFDGTIADSATTMLECANLLSEKYNYPKLTDWNHFRNKSSKEILNKELRIAWYRMPFFLNDARKIFQKRQAQVKLFDDIKELLYALADHYKVIIVTSNAPETVKSILRRYGVNCIETIEGNVSVNGKKKRIRSLMKTMNKAPNEFTYIGDEIRDLKASKDTGINFVGVSWGLHTKEFFFQEGAETVVDTPLELLEELLRRSE